MLPTYPEIEKVVAEGIRLRIQAIGHQLNPLLAEIRKATQFEGEGTAFVEPTGRTRDSPMTTASAEMVVERRPLDDQAEEYLSRKLLDGAKQFATQLQALVFRTLDEGTSEAGTVVDAKGHPLTVDLMLEGLETMDHAFDDDGNWIPPTFVGSPAMISTLAKVMTPAEIDRFNKALGRMLEKKHDEYRRRKADRILVG